MADSARGVQSLKLGSAVQVLPLVAGYGVQIATTPYVLTRLGLHDFGIWSVTGAIAQYGAMFDLGVSRAAGRYVALFHAKSDAKSEGRVVAICVITLLALWALLSGLVVSTAPVISSVFRLGSPTVARYLLLSAVAILIVGLLARVLAAASIGSGRVVPTTVGIAVLSVLQAAGGVVALIFDDSLTAFAYGTLAGASCGLIIVAVIKLVDERRIVFAMPTLSLTRELFAYGIPSQISAVGDMLLLQSGKIIAGAMLGPAAAGIYELANRLATGAQVLGTASAHTLTPHLTRIFVEGGKDSVVAQYEHLTQRNTSVALIFPFVMGASAASAIPLWLNSANDRVVIVLLALLSGIAVNLSTAVCSYTLLALGRPTVIAFVTVVGGSFQTITAVAATHFWGFAGLAASLSIGIPVVKLLGLWYMQSSSDIPLKLYTRGVAGPFAVALLATIAALPPNLIATLTSRQSAVVPFTTSIVVFSSIYLFLSWRRGYLPELSLRPDRLKENR